MCKLSFEEEISLYIHSGYTLIFVFTHEEEEVFSSLKNIAVKLDRKYLQLRSFGNCSNAVDLLKQTNEENSIIVLDNIHFSLKNGEIISILVDISVEADVNNRAVVIVGPWVEIPIELQKKSIIIETALPSELKLKEVLQQILKDQKISFLPNKNEIFLRALRGFTKIEAYRTLKKAFLQHSNNFDKVLSQVIFEKNRFLRNYSALESIEISGSLSEIGGMDRLKDWLSQRKDAFLSEAKAFGLPSPRGLLLTGVQGCGKSLMAKTVANYWQLPLARLDISAIFGSAYPESSLRDAIIIAEAMSPIVVWIDEIEKVFDNNLGGLGARILGKTVTWLQEKQQEVFVVATANRVDKLPPELIRKGRFDEVFFVDLPDFIDRKEIISIHIEKRGRKPSDFNIDELSKKTERFTGSELEQLVISSLFSAYTAKRELSEKDFYYSIQEFVPLFDMYEEEIKALREWATKRARPASTNRKKVEMFSF